MRAAAASIAALAVCIPALAYADGYPAPTQPAAYAPFSWTGFYIGANGGYAWEADRKDLVITNNLGATLPTTSLDARGGFAGGQAGYNWQTGPLVLGFEADLQGGSIDDRFHRIFAGNDVNAFKQLDSFGTVRGRVGYAFNRVLVYGTGGFAYGNIRDTILVNSVADLHRDGTETGFAAGGGLEYAIDRHFSMKVEYQHLDFGSDRLSAPVLPPNGVIIFSNRIDHTFDSVRIGLNYRFHDDYAPLK